MTPSPRLKSWLWRTSGAFLIVESPAICGAQAWRIVETGSARDVSLLAWFAATVSSVVWALHADRVRDRVMRWASWTWTASNAVVLVVAVAYRAKAGEL